MPQLNVHPSAPYEHWFIAMGAAAHHHGTNTEQTTHGGSVAMNVDNRWCPATTEDAIDH
jgi:hypothetical protein